MLEKIKKKYTEGTLYYSFFDRASKIPSDDWSSINRDNNLFLTIDYLHTLENTLSDTISFRYIIFYDSNGSVGIAVTQLIKFRKLY